MTAPDPAPRPDGAAQLAAFIAGQAAAASAAAAQIGAIMVPAIAELQHRLAALHAALVQVSPPPVTAASDQARARALRWRRRQGRTGPAPRRLDGRRG